MESLMREPTNITLFRWETSDDLRRPAVISFVSLLGLTTIVTTESRCRRGTTCMNPVGWRMYVCIINRFDRCS